MIYTIVMSALIGAALAIWGAIALRALGVL